MKKKSKLIPPTEKEEVAINTGIDADPDTWEATKKRIFSDASGGGSLTGSGRKLHK